MISETMKDGVHIGPSSAKCKYCNGIFVLEIKDGEAHLWCKCKRDWILDNVLKDYSEEEILEALKSRKRKEK